MKVQFHVHTRFSKDSLLPLFVLYRACRICGIGCVCITDHNTIDGAVKFKEKYGSKGIDVVVGEEIFTGSGEVIGLYLTENIPAGLSVDETIKRIRSQGGLVIVPHPYEVERGKTALPESVIADHAKEFDAAEFFNGRNFKAEYSTKQNEICQKYGLAKILGSDAHTVYEIGKNTFEIGEKVTKDSFLSALHQAEFSPKHMPRIVHYVTKIHKLVKLIFGKYR